MADGERLVVAPLHTDSLPERLLAARAIALAAFGKESISFQCAPSHRKELLFHSSFVGMVDNVVIAYGCVKPHHCSNVEGGRKEAILHSLCVGSEWRGNGFGQGMVSGICETLRNDYSIDFCLLTPAKEREEQLIRLYERCGFTLMREGDDVAALGSALSAKLTAAGTEVDGIANLFRKRAGLAGSSGEKWMRRRLRYRSSAASRKFVPVPRAHQVVAVTWEPQVGPMCGISAVYMASSMPASPKARPLDGFEAVVSAESADETNLLKVAQARNLSVDGEMFNARSLASLASSVPSLLASFSPNFASPATLQTGIDRGGVFLLPFDVVGNRACSRGGGSAHWGLVTGYYEDSAGELGLAVQHSGNDKPFYAKYEEMMASNAQLFAANVKFKHATILLQNCIIYLKKEVA